MSKADEIIQRCRYSDPVPDNHDKGTPVVVGYEALRAHIAVLEYALTVNHELAENVQGRFAPRPPGLHNNRAGARSGLVGWSLSARERRKDEVEEMKSCDVCGEMSRGGTLHDRRFHALADQVSRLTRVVCWLGSALGPHEWNEVDKALQGQPSEVDEIDVPLRDY